MDSYVKTITLDVNADQNYTIVKAKQGDKINRKIAITLKKDGSNFTQTGVSEIWFRVEKPDKNIAIVKSTDSGNPISVNGNVYTVSLSEQCLTASGKAWCDLAFLDSSGNTLSSCAFIMNIIPMPNGNTAESISEWTDLQKAIDDAERFADIVAFRTSGNYIQYTVDGQTWTNLVNVGAIGGDLQNQIGNLSDLTTTNKTSLVGAANELKGSLNSLVIVGDNTPFTAENIPSNAILKGTFVLNSLYEMSANQVLIGAGCIITVSGNDAQIKLNNNVIIDGINFKGAWNPTRTTSGAHLVPILTEAALSSHAQTVYAENTDIYHSLLYTDTSIAERIKIVNCNFENINKCCIWIMGGDHSTMKRTIIANNHFQTVWCGVAIFSEFCSLSANIYDRCITGNSISSGNAAVTGQIFKQCDCAIYYGANGGNSAHNEVTGCELAHSNLFGLYIKNITNATGNLFSGCQIVDSPIKAETAYDVAFVGCRIDTYVIISAGANNLITNCLVGDAYLDGHSLFAVVGTFIYDNKPLRSTSEASINPYPPSYTSELTLQTANAARGAGTVTYSLDTRIATIQGRADNYYDSSFHAIPIGTSSNRNPIFTIPSGCRPKTNIAVPATFIMMDGTSATYELLALTTGEVYNGYSSNVRSVMFSASYVFN